jgi:steroid 5-alpha reductase family enzyme
MKKYIATAVSACIVILLAVLCILFRGEGFSALQEETFKLLTVICAASALYCFVVGEITKNYSQMDKLWSILPIVYAWIIAAKGDFSLRLIVYAVIVTAWGIRLTVNFARKGAYRLKFWEGREDYRWSVVKSSPVFSNGFLWTLFDLFFISIYQNLLVLAICLPALACMGSSEPFAAADIVAAVLAVAFLVLETVADEYQWNFHKKKQGFLAEGKTLSELPSPYNLGFNTLGPWSRMRHPNYLGEQGIWLSLYLFTIGAGVTSNGIFNITAIGPLLLILLFMGSSALGEKISSGKYPSYKDYINQVYKYLPLKKFKP